MVLLFGHVNVLLTVSFMKLGIYEIHIFELRNEEINVVGLLAQLVRALHRYRRGQGSNPGKPDFFRLSFRNCISCVNNCEDLLYIYLVSFILLELGLTPLRENIVVMLHLSCLVIIFLIILLL